MGGEGGCKDIHRRLKRGEDRNGRRGKGGKGRWEWEGGGRCYRVVMEKSVATIEPRKRERRGEAGGGSKEARRGEGERAREGEGRKVGRSVDLTVLFYLMIHFPFFYNNV